jgi:putative CocE/NonD family hydrolase
MSNFNLLWGVKIPMRDGVQLNATLYTPKADSPTPVVFTFTPYVSDRYHRLGVYFAQHGYAFAVADCRGRGNSQGEYISFDPQHSLDGYDLTEWLASQPWCDGQVTMWGASYGGTVQWLTARELPPHLATIVPTASGYAGVDFPYFRNIPYSYMIQYLALIAGATPNNNLFADESFWRQVFLERYLKHIPFRKLDELAGLPSLQFQRFLDHPHPDSHLDQATLTPEQYARIRLPVLTITGHYDDDQPGAFAYYRQHLQHTDPATRDQHYLVIGPWDHAGTGLPYKEVGGLTFGEASMIDMFGLHVDWFNWRLKGGEKPAFLQKRVAYYVLGLEQWKYADSLDSIADENRRLFLTSESGCANDVFHSGSLINTPKPSAPDAFTYDPLDSRSAELEMDDNPNYLTDQRYALNLFGNGLVYHSEPFAEATEISGQVKLTAWLEMDVPDTDFVVSLYEIKFDGSSILLTRDFMRARYRESLREPKLVTAGEINQYTFDGFKFFSRQIAKNSRLRLVIQCSNTIHLQKNYNSGGDVSNETDKDVRTAHVKLHHDEQHPSVLELSIVHGESK